ncbi:MAG: hypothetical protein ACRD2J_17580 [Thermoanaerobaculia bacterium]
MERLDLAPHQFLQFNGILGEMIGPNVYNHRIAVRVIEGEGRVTGYLALVENATNDPTYFPAQ